MIPNLEALLAEHRHVISRLFRRYIDLGRPLLLRSDLVDTFESLDDEDSETRLVDTRFAGIIRSAQEAVVHAPFIYLALRARVADWHYAVVHAEEMHVRAIGVSEFLAAKERLVDGEAHAGGPDAQRPLEVDLAPFERDFPKLKDARSIGNGVEFLNRHLASRLFDRDGRGRALMFRFLTVHQVRGQQLMLNELLADADALGAALADADDFLASQKDTAEWPSFAAELKRMGFEPGWGRTAEQVRDTMSLLADLLEAPAAANLEKFLRRIPMLFSIAIISPHGYFGQAGVLGKPDTGGQVVYILDQVRALEAGMRRSIHNQGLDIEPEIVVLTRQLLDAEGTTCDQKLEPIAGTESARILRVPFRDAAGEVIPHWISRFKIWPYLERFADESEKEIVNEIGGRPDFIIGNYSDGNLVASILAHRLDVTQCNIAHALEKTKYLHSSLYWRDHEEDHRFSCQYTADLIAMNTADFIITSTRQEIAGTRTSVGQYESYRAFSMPGLYRVVNGIDPYDPKFNIVSPGADPNVFFPFGEGERRLPELGDEIRDMIFGGDRPDALGFIAEPGKPLLFAMSRLDTIKNMAGLVAWYGASEELRREANLVLVGGFHDPDRSADTEERAQVERMHELFAQYGLHNQVRWVEMQTDKSLVGEFYRVVADTRGAFVQPALFEAFGLTVIEAMTCGLPTFATRYGGPLESIEHGVSGFHIDPNHGAEAAHAMAAFFQECGKDDAYWDRISKGSIDRVAKHYTWSLYADRLLALSRIYGFWKYITRLERAETARYLEMFYALMFRPRAALLEQGS